MKRQVGVWVGTHTTDVVWTVGEVALLHTNNGKVIYIDVYLFPKRA